MVEPSPNSDFAWPGEGFTNFPKTLPEDCIEYAIFILDNNLLPNEILSKLRTVEKAATDLCKDLLKDYIWQRDPFVLSLEHKHSTWVLHGLTNYGDSVADEWLIVYFLRSLSQKFPEAWIRTSDSDGEFLLIEAANTLPRWLNPEVAPNRVWIHNGKLLIIPKSTGTTSKEANKGLTLQEAIIIATEHPENLSHSPLIEEEAFFRLKKYPGEIENSLHHSLVTMPRRLAFVLKQNPSYISPAIEAFYLRDPVSFKPLAKSYEQGKSNLSFPPDDFVTVSTRFNRVGYAQLYSQQFDAPPAWEGKMIQTSDDVDKKRVEIGMKLACGFEMLVSDPQQQDKKSTREIKMLLEDLVEGEESLPSDKDIEAWEKRDDDEGWLDIDFEDFEKELSGKGKAKGEGDLPGNFGDKGAQENLRKMVERFESFLNDDEAGMDGAEMDDMDEDDDDDEDESDEDDDSEGEDKELAFDEEQFAKMMREMMGMPSEERGMPKDPKEKKEIADAMAKLAEMEPEGAGQWDDDEDDDESDIDIEEIKKMSERMEAELRGAGALTIDPEEMQTGKEQAALKDGPRNGKGKGKATVTVDNDEGGEGSDEDDEIDVDYNLAKNLLESFKGQGGLAGPAGNMMGLMGTTMPRDEGEKDEKEKT